MLIQPVINAAPGLVVDIAGDLNPSTDVLMNGLPPVDQSFTLSEPGYYEIDVTSIAVRYRIVVVEPTAVRASIRRIQQDDAPLAGRRMMAIMPSSYARGQAASVQADTRIYMQVDRAVALDIEAMLPSGLFRKVAELPAKAAGFWWSSGMSVSRGLNRFRMTVTTVDSPVDILATVPTDGGSIETGQTYEVQDLEAPAV